MTRNENITHSKVKSSSSHSDTRYWGKVEVIEKGKNYQVNRIEIQPKHGIKQQIHDHPCEHWAIASGIAKVICSTQETLLNRQELTFVPPATPDKVDNPGQIPLIILAIQNGDYLGEDDTKHLMDLTLV